MTKEDIVLWLNSVKSYSERSKGKAFVFALFMFHILLVLRYD